MAGTGGASMVESEGSDVRRCDSENGNKRIKYAEEEDRISTLPDFLIQRILSFLPATDLVKTLVLSKLWKCQWTQVPVLKFVPNHGMSADQFSNFIDKTLSLHDCSNLEKFVINLKSFAMADRFPDLEVWIHFAVRKDVKELVVNFNDDTKYLVPEFLLDTYSLVKLKLSTCNFMENGIEEVNWKYLKSLNLYDCDLGDDTIENVLCCTPLLEYLELSGCDMFQELVIASKSLKTLILDGVRCECNYFEISSPNLERLRISGLVWFTTLKLMNLTSSVNVTLDFYFDMEELEGEMSHDDYINLVQQTLRQVEHVEKLEIGRWLMEILSTCKEDGDCIGGLPDSFIHRIISFFPSTKDAFESDLYKTWKLKWTDAPVPNFVSNEKFVMNSRCYPLVYLDPRLSLWIRLAARKDVKELILDCDATMVDSGDEYPLPQFLFNNSSLVTMKICACDFVPNEKVNWESLKSLHLYYSELGDQAIEHVLSGSPLLEDLKLHCCGFEGAVVVASEHLKIFNLEEFGKSCHLLEISCPNLEKLKIWGNLGSTSLKLMSLPSSLHATLGFYSLESDDITPDDCMNLVEEIMKQIVHVEELEIELSRMKS